jgi:hypothetical protein
LGIRTHDIEMAVRPNRRERLGTPRSGGPQGAVQDVRRHPAERVIFPGIKKLAVSMQEAKGVLGMVRRGLGVPPRSIGGTLRQAREFASLEAPSPARPAF